MGKTNSKKSYVKTSADKPTRKPPPGDKTPGLDPERRFYAIEDSDNTKEGEESEIIVFHDSSLAVFKKNLVNRKCPYINTFNNEGPTVASTMIDLTRDNLYYGCGSKGSLYVAHPERGCA